MPKSRRPAVEIQFGGKVRHLIFGHHALGELEEKAAELPDTCTTCREPKGLHVAAIHLGQETADCPWASDGTPAHQTTYAAVSRIKSVILAAWAGLLTETLDSQGRETARTLSRFQVAAILDTMEDVDIEVLAGKIGEAMKLSKPVTDPPQASEAELSAPSEN